MAKKGIYLSEEVGFKTELPKAKKVKTSSVSSVKKTEVKTKK